MKTFNKLWLLLFLFAMIACEEPIEPLIHESDNLMGFWVNPTPADTCWRYERFGAFQQDGYGFSFQSDHSFTERKNAGFCGTPPVFYDNFEGSWSSSDSLISITVDYWGGTVDYQWKIISLDDQYLTIYKMKEEYHIQE